MTLTFSWPRVVGMVLHKILDQYVSSYQRWIKSVIRLRNNEVLKTLTKTLTFVDTDANANDGDSTIALREHWSGELKKQQQKNPKKLKPLQLHRVSLDKRNIQKFSYFSTKTYTVDTHFHGEVKVSILFCWKKVLSGAMQILTLVMLNKLRCHTHF